MDRLLLVVTLLFIGAPQTSKPELDFSERFMSLEMREAGMARGDKKFPTMDAALIGLAFLTFAVCLIDLIKKFITKLQAKKGAMMTTTGGTGGTPTATAKAHWDSPKKPLEELTYLVTNALQQKYTHPDCGGRVLCRAQRFTASPPPLLMQLLRWILGFTAKEAEQAARRIKLNSKMSLPVQKMRRVTYSGLVIVVYFRHLLALPTDDAGFNNLQFTRRSTELPGWGELGDHVNDIVQIALDALTIFMHQSESPDCALRLLCESSQRTSVQRSVVKSLLSYLVGLVLAFWLEGHTVSDGLMAMREGRKGSDCITGFPKCPISL